MNIGRQALVTQGMVKQNKAARRERLRAAGMSDADIDRIDGPAGISIGAIGPAEIALSIAAGMVQAFHG